MVAVCLTEATYESKTTRKNLFVPTLDTQKAFDVASHPVLMAGLAQTEIPDDLWLAC